MAFKFLFFLACVAVVRASVIAPAGYVSSELNSHPQYSYSYGVNDAHTGYSKSQTETRSGDVVQGQYYFVESDGSRRTVDYAADPINGFNAVIRKDGLNVQSAPVAVAPAFTVARSAPVAVAAPDFKVARSTPVVSAPAVSYSSAPAVSYSTSSQTFTSSVPVAHSAVAAPELAVARATPFAVPYSTPIVSAPPVSYSNAPAVSYSTSTQSFSNSVPVARTVAVASPEVTVAHTAPFSVAQSAPVVNALPVSYSSAPAVSYSTSSQTFPNSLPFARTVAVAAPEVAVAHTAPFSVAHSAHIVSAPAIPYSSTPAVSYSTSSQAYPNSIPIARTVAVAAPAVTVARTNPVAVTSPVSVASPVSYARSSQVFVNTPTIDVAHAVSVGASPAVSVAAPAYSYARTANVALTPELVSPLSHTAGVVPYNLASPYSFTHGSSFVHPY